MLLRGKEQKPYIVGLYGSAGVGKSTLANGAKLPVFINLEDALHHIDCVRSPVIKSSAELRTFLNKLCTEHSDEFGTIVIDTVDALEDILIAEICKEHNKQSIASFGFGAGYALLNKKWCELISGFQYMSRQWGFNIIFILHDQIKRFEDPTGEAYDRISLKMDNKSALSFVSKVDAVFFMAYDKIVRASEETGKRKAVGTGRRVIYTQDSASFVAKNRYDLEKKIEVSQDFFMRLEKLTLVEN